ncbi:MAG: VOC family protein [Sphingomonadales bacterium]
MARVLALGGIFFKCENPMKLRDWYIEHLNMPAGHEEHPSLVLPYGGDAPGYSVWGPFSRDTEYFKPSNKAYMINLRVDNLEEMLAELKTKGVEQIGDMEDSEFGKFAWIMDPEGTKIELWEAPAQIP